MNTNTIEVDAKGKTVGRVASYTASLLGGKHETTYTPHRKPETKVVVKNVDELLISRKKIEQKTYTAYSGYPGGFKKRTVGHMLKKPEGKKIILRKAIYRMLPSNRLRSLMMKNLTIVN